MKVIHLFLTATLIIFILYISFKSAHGTNNYMLDRFTLDEDDVDNAAAIETITTTTTNVQNDISLTYEEQATISNGIKNDLNKVYDNAIIKKFPRTLTVASKIPISEIIITGPFENFQLYAMNYELNQQEPQNSMYVYS